MNKKQKLYQAIEKHGQNLNNIFNSQYDNITLCKKLRRIENKAHFATTCLLNTNTLNYMNSEKAWTLKQVTEEEEDIFFDKIMKSVVKVLGEKAREYIHINYDARGYALKIKTETMEVNFKLYRDFGGYGIICPDFN